MAFLATATILQRDQWGTVGPEPNPNAWLGLDESLGECGLVSLYVRAKTRCGHVGVRC